MIMPRKTSGPLFPSPFLPSASSRGGRPRPGGRRLKATPEARAMPTCSHDHGARTSRVWRRHMAAETHHSKGKVPRQKRTPEGVPEDSAAVTEGEKAGCQGVDGAWGYPQRDCRGERKRTLDCSPDCSAQSTKIVAHGSGLEEGPTLHVAHSLSRAPIFRAATLST